MTRIARLIGAIAATMLVAECFAESPTGSRLDLQPRPLATLPGGLVIGRDMSGYSDIVLVASPRIAAGDVAQASDMVAKLAETFTTVILANVVRQADGSFQIDKFAMGQATPIGGSLTVVTSDTHQKLNAGLGFIGGRVLRSSEQALAKARQIARYPGMVIYDVPAIVHRDQRHQELVVRHAVWASPRSGRLGSLMWLLRDRGAEDRYAWVDHEVRFVAAGTREDRVLHVDGGQFTFGVPSAKAFAMQDLPPGKSHRPSKLLLTLGARRSLDAAALARLPAAFRESMLDQPAAKSPQQSP